VPGLILAQATSDNAPGGAYFSLWFPLGLFIIVCAILWVLYSRPHRRVPPRRPAHAHAGGGAHAAGTGSGPGQHNAAMSAAGAASGAPDAGDTAATGPSGGTAAGVSPAEPGTSQQPGAEGPEVSE
jgi:hypothetical protein